MGNAQFHMIENNAVKKMVNSILRNQQNTFSDRDIMHPEREWFLGISAGVIVLVLAIFWSVNTYLQFNNISVINSGEQEKSAVYKALLVETALTDFADRKKMYEDLKGELISENRKAEVFVPVFASSTNSHDVSTTSSEEGDGATLTF